MSCEHGLTTKDCYVCMSPKYGKNDTKQEFVAKPQGKRHEWVDLTRDEIWEVYKKHGSLQYKAFARAIEQALKEKNSL